MQTNPEQRFNRRRHERFTLPPMYTPIVIRRAWRDQGLAIQTLEGHAYDISEAGVRLEVDEPLDLGEVVRLTIELPCAGGTIGAWAEVVRVYDAEDDPGARRAALQITEFISPADHARLIAHIGSGTLRRAA